MTTIRKGQRQAVIYAKPNIDLLVVVVVVVSLELTSFREETLSDLRPSVEVGRDRCQGDGKEGGRQFHDGACARDKK
jgi:hypothetical protein